MVRFNRIKRVLSIFSVAVLFTVFPAFAANVPALKGRVNDYAKIIRDSDEREIEEYLAGVNRVNRQDPTSSLQGQIRDDYLKRFPDYRSNPYVRSSPMKYHVLDRLIRQGNWKAVHSLMGIKTKMKGR